MSERVTFVFNGIQWVRWDRGLQDWVVVPGTSINIPPWGIGGNPLAQTEVTAPQPSIDDQISYIINNWSKPDKLKLYRLLNADGQRM